jgi:hypothetical protein
MFELDGSETSWLVYADWLEDQGIDAAHIRESVDINHFCHEPYSGNVGACTFSLREVGFYCGRDEVGTTGHPGTDVDFIPRFGKIGGGFNVSIGGETSVITTVIKPHGLW